MRCAAYNLIGLVVKDDGTVEIRISEKHLNYAGIGLGMFAFALGDAAMRIAITNSIPDKKAVTATAAIDYKKPARKGDILTATVEIFPFKGRKIFTTATICNQNNEVVATMEALFIIIEN